MTAVTRLTAATVAAALGCVGASLLPWLQTGEATRSAFGLVRSVSALGLFDGTARRLCVGVWYLMPFLTAATWTAAAARKPMLCAILGATVGATAAAAGIIVLAMARVEAGPVAAIGAGALAVGSGALLARASRAGTAVP